MGYLFTVLFILLGMSIFFLRNYEKQWLEEKILRKDLLYFLYPASLWLYDQIRKRQEISTEDKNFAKAVYVGEKPFEKLRLRQAGKLRCVWLALAFSFLLGALLGFQKEMPKESEGVLQRPSFGETQSYEIIVDGLTEKTETITVEVSGREVNDSQMQSIFDEAWNNVKTSAIGDNLSADEVRSNLNLVSVTDYGIRVEWTSYDPTIINDRGQIVAGEIPDEGLIAGLRAELSYASQSSLYELYVHLYPQKKDAQYWIDAWSKTVKDTEEQSRKDNSFTLPQQIEEKTLSYREKNKEKPWWLLILLPFAAVLIVFADRENLKTEYKKRNLQLQKYYPAFLFKLSLMIGCGLTIRNAWDRIVQDYTRKKEAGFGKKEYLYEEMLAAQNRIYSGEGEASAYRSFSRSCREDCYLRLGNYLEQNMKQGASGIQKMLETEMTLALEEQKYLALKMGEEMNTKLLIPMFLMLIVVMLVLISPALLSM